MTPDPVREALRSVVFEGLTGEGQLIPSEALRVKLVAAREVISSHPPAAAEPDEDAARVDLLDDLEDGRLELKDRGLETTAALIGKAIDWISGEREDAAPSPQPTQQAAPVTGAPDAFRRGHFERRLFDRLFGFQGGKLQNDCAAIGAEADAALQAAQQRAEAAEAWVEALQKALFFWLPCVPSVDGAIADRIADDAMLLRGDAEFDMEVSAESAGWITLNDPPKEPTHG